MKTTLAEPLDPALLGPTTQVHARSIDRFARAHDASHYLLIPDAVLSPLTRRVSLVPSERSELPGAR